MLSEAFAAALPSIGLNGILEAFTWSEVSSSEDLFGDREWGNASAPASLKHSSPSWRLTAITESERFQLLHFVGSWVMECSGSRASAEVIALLSRRESLLTAFDSGAFLHAAVWRAVLAHHIVASDPSQIGSPKPSHAWDFLLALCAPSSRSVTARASCIHGGGHGFLLSAMAAELLRANYTGCHLLPFATPRVLSVSTLGRAQALCDAAPAPQLGAFCSGGIYDQLRVTMQAPPTPHGDGSSGHLRYEHERPRDLLRTDERSGRPLPWLWPCGIVPRSAAAFCFALHASFRQPWAREQTCLHDPHISRPANRRGWDFANGGRACTPCTCRCILSHAHGHVSPTTSPLAASRKHPSTSTCPAAHPPMAATLSSTRAVPKNGWPMTAPSSP